MCHIGTEIQKAKAIAGGMGLVAINAMVATRDYADAIRTAWVLAGACREGSAFGVQRGNALPPALPQVCKDVRHGAHLVQHSGHLTGHQAAAYRVALKDGAAQTAQRVFFQFHLVRARLFLTDILPAHTVFQHTHRCAYAAPGNDGVTVPGFEQRGLVVFVNGALFACQQAGTHLHTAGAQRQRKADAFAQIVVEEKVAVVTTGAGNPGKYVPMGMLAALVLPWRSMFL